MLDATLIALVAGAASGALVDVRTVHESSPEGTHRREETRAAAPAAREAAGFVATGTGSVLWHRNLVDAIYTSAELVGPDSSLAAGSYLNPPMRTELFATEGPNVPEWFVDGTRFSVSASRNAETVAAVDIVSGSSTVTVIKWHADSGTPDWDLAISPASAATERSIAVSGDGSTIAALVTSPDSTNARLYAFDQSSSTPLWTFDAPAGAFARTLVISEDGATIAFRSGSWVHVVERATGAERWSQNVLFSSAQLALSGDGDVLAYGTTGLFVRSWNGSSYALLWTEFDGSYRLASCALNANGTVLATGWNRTTFTQNRVRIYELPSSTPLWTFETATGDPTYQDLPVDVALTDDGELIAVASFGDSLNTNPELHVFSKTDAIPVAGIGPVPLFTLDTPGSMFDVDVAPPPGGGAGVYVTVCGKNVHANQTGRGGDLYSIWIPPLATSAPPAGPGEGRLAVWPNPFRRDLTISLGSAPERAPVSVYTVTGRRVRTLDASGGGRATWDGRDADGRPLPAGVYLVRGSVGETRRVVLLR